MIRARFIAVAGAMTTALLGLAGTLLAGPLDKAVVAKQAQWVVHVDAEAAIASSLGRYMVTNRESSKGLDIPLAFEQFQREFGIDPIVSLKGITVYGMGPDERDAVAIVYTTPAIEEFIEKMSALDSSIRRVDFGSVRTYAWSEGGLTRYAHVREAGEGRVVVAAADKERLLSAIGLIEGRGETAAGVAEGILAEGPGEGSIVYAAALKLPEARALPFKHAEAFRLDAGERGEEMYADMKVRAASSEEAMRLAQVAMGALAMAQIGVAGEPGLKEAGVVLNAFRIDSEGAEVTGTFRLSSGKVVSAVTALLKFQRDQDRAVKDGGKSDDGAEGR